MIADILTTRRTLATLLSVSYVWFLPVLAIFGFAEPNSTSISAFISNPPATGAMAALSFIPAIIMWEYQDFIVKSKKLEQQIQNRLYNSISIFQFFYGAFLTCTVTCVPSWLHTGTVVCFGASYIFHSCLILSYIEPSNIGCYILTLGTVTFIVLPFMPGMYFWATECVGFSVMMLFTPIECYLFDSANYQKNSLTADLFAAI